ncbi:MAG TPA: alpha-L-arabinofuranosidase C-terminal domain-containing protein, partial [Verrucomicrobiae bacterium]
LSLHYYTIPTGNWSKKGSATDFEENEWFSTLNRAEGMEALIERHSAIMDKADPQKHIGLMVDEWGTWCDAEPGTNPGFLYQQNSLRDALVAAITLNIFNQHCDRVKMSNIAQMINVLQSMILTDKEKMIVTPTYYVYEMFVPHHDAKLLPEELTCGDYALNEQKIPGLSASSSVDSTGAIHVTLCNLNPNNPASLTCQIQGAMPKTVSGQVLTASEMTAHNTFENPNAVKPEPFTAVQMVSGGFSATLPPKSVVAIELK